MNDHATRETNKAEKPSDSIAPQTESSTVQLADECVTLRQKVYQLEVDAAHTLGKLDELRQSESKYRELVEASGSIVLRMDPHGNITFANRHALSFFGYAEDELLGKNVVGTIVPFVEQSGRDLAELIQNICDHPEQYQDSENENIQQDGTSKWIAWTNRGIRDSLGRPQEILSIGNDITARKLAEEKLEQEQQMLRHLLESQQHDRKLVAYEIHDGITQLLTVANMYLESYDSMKESSPKAAQDCYLMAREFLERSISEARRLITDLRPPVLEKLGIMSAIQQLIDTRGHPDKAMVEFVCDMQHKRLDSLIENTLYRIAQEGLNNVIQHSGSEKALIRLEEQDGSILLEIKDWGQGFDPATVSADRFGLRGIRERIQILDGKVTIESTPGQGTLISARIPLKFEEESIAQEQ